MDEKQITAAFEEKYGTRPVAKGSFAMQMAALEDAAEWDARLEAWLACCQHLGPQLKDGERYRMLRSQESPDLTVQYWDGDFWQEDGGEGLDKAVDAALALQKEKQQC